MPLTGEFGPPRFAQGADSDDGDFSTPLVAAVPGKKIRVIGLVVTVLTTAGVFSLKSNTTTIFAQHLALGSPLVLTMPGLGICETAAGEALLASNAAGVDSFVNVTIQEIQT